MPIRSQRSLRSPPLPLPRYGGGEIFQTGPRRKFSWAALIAGILVGCTLRGPTAIPTPYPEDFLPTVLALTGQAALATSSALTPTAGATKMADPTATSIPATAEPTRTPTPEPGFDDFAQIRFLSPGPMSKVVSPLHVQMLLVAGESNIVQMDLLGEDGRKLYAETLRVKRNEAGVYRTWEIPFEIRAAAEQGWLQVSSKDDEGRMQVLNSLRLLLLSVGTNEINPPGNVIYERVVLQAPEDGALVSGGILDVRGRVWPMNDDPVFLELILPDGKIAGARVLDPPGLMPQSFTTTIPYRLTVPENSTEPLKARLSVRQVDPILQIPIYVYSAEVLLRP